MPGGSPFDRLAWAATYGSPATATARPKSSSATSAACHSSRMIWSSSPRRVLTDRPGRRPAWCSTGPATSRSPAASGRPHHRAESLPVRDRQSSYLLGRSGLGRLVRLPHQQSRSRPMARRRNGPGEQSDPRRYRGRGVRARLYRHWLPTGASERSVGNLYSRSAALPCARDRPSAELTGPYATPQLIFRPIVP
jgi:hypothetical protein